MSNWQNMIGSLFVANHRQIESMVHKSIGNRETAADIVQDVFTRALAAGPKGAAGDERRMLYASARNAAIDHHRTERRRSRLTSMIVPEQYACGFEVSPEARLEARQELSALEAALAELSPRCREIFILRRVHGLSNMEIARRHGISVNTVEKYIARALRHCQNRLWERS
jgi:RNA polymerase sigma factor (sigma-70 family)